MRWTLRPLTLTYCYVTGMHATGPEIKQIAGRAGRYMTDFEEGRVSAKNRGYVGKLPACACSFSTRLPSCSLLLLASDSWWLGSHMAIPV